MLVNEFARYVINNMGRATLGNALNIANRFSSGDYNFIEFLNQVNVYVADLLKSNTLNSIKCYNILSITDKTLKLYNSEFNYNKSFIVDDFIIDIWSVLNGN